VSLRVAFAGQFALLEQFENVMSENRRTAFRCPIPAEIAVVRTHHTDLVVRVVEESTGGYAISTNQPKQFREGDKLSIAYNGGITAVSVAHVTNDDEGCRVGLERRGELKYLHNFGLFHGFSPRALFTTPRGWLRTALMVAMVFTLINFGPEATAFVRHQVASQIAAYEEAQKQIAEQQKAKEKSGPEKKRMVAMSYQQLGEVKSRQYSEVLQLDRQQQQQIQAVVQETSQRLAAAYQKHKNADDNEVWSDEALTLLESSIHEVEKTMTFEQREKWNKLRAQQNKQEEVQNPPLAS